MAERNQGYLHTPKESSLGKLVEVSELFNIHKNPNAKKGFIPSKERILIDQAYSLGEQRRRQFIEEINKTESKKEAAREKRQAVLA